MHMAQNIFDNKMVINKEGTSRVGLFYCCFIAASGKVLLGPGIRNLSSCCLILELKGRLPPALPHVHTVTLAFQENQSLILTFWVLVHPLVLLDFLPDSLRQEHFQHHPLRVPALPPPQGQDRMCVPTSPKWASERPSGWEGRHAT